MVLTSLTLTLSVIVLTFLVVIFWKKNFKLPPGPWGLPFFGYYPFLSDKPYIDFYKLSKRYGDVISFRTVGGKLIVVLNGAKVIKNVLVNRSEEFVGRPEEDNLLAWISDGLGVTQEEGAVWKEHRRFFLQTAKNYGFGKQESEEMIHEQIRAMISDLTQEKGQPSDIRFHISYTVSSIVSTILFSKKFKKYGDCFPNIFNSAMHLIEIFADQRYMLVGPFYEYIVMKLFPSAKRIWKAREVFRKVIKEIVDEHVKTFDPDNLRDYVDGYLYQAYKLAKSGEKHSFTMKRLHSISLNMLMEGTESVGATISELLHEASRHPEKQKLVQEELDHVVGRERLPSWRDRQKLPYLEAFIQELLRLNMAFKISTHYCNYKETTIEGYRIPRRTILVANLWTINHDTALYPEPSKFEPKRFIGKDGKKIKTEGPYPFGIGITQEEGLPWKAHRHFFIHSLKSLGLGNQDTETRIQEEIKTLIKDVKKSNGEPIDLSFHIAYAVNSVINPILFAKKYEKFSSEFKEVADGARYLVEQFVTKQYLLVGRLYKYIVMTLFPSTKNYRKAKESFERIAKTIVDDHVETFDPSNIRDYVDSFLYEAHKLHKHGGVKEDIFTRDRLYGITLNMLMEGTETVAGTLFGMLIEIARHPEEQKLVQEELDTVVGEERLPSWADRRNMPYFRAFLQELSRVCAPFNLSTYYSNFEETTLQGYRIPKRSILVANLWTINNDPFLYPNPKKFDPKRFLEDQRNKNGKVGPCIYGVGKRTCIVESLADKETFLVISSILQNFTLLPAKKEDLIKAVPRISIAV